MATPLNGRPHTTLSAEVEDLTTSDLDPSLLSLNGASVEDSNSSSLSDDEVQSAYCCNEITADIIGAIQNVFNYIPCGMTKPPC